MKRKLIAILLTGCMLLTPVLAGCGSTEGETAGNTESNADPGQSAESQNGTTAEASGQEGNTASETSREEITVTMMVTEAATQEMPETSPLLEAIKEKFNINLELMIVPGSDYTTKKSTVLASNSMPDIVGGMTVDEVKKYGASGMFLSLDDYQAYAPDYFGLVDAEDRRVETNKLRVNDQLYCFEKLEKNRIALSSSIAIRMDLLEEQNIPVPATWDEYYAALLKIKEKHPDMYGFATRNETNYLIGQFAYGLGTGGFPLFNVTRGIYLEPESDTYVYGPTSEKFTRVVEFLRQAYADGILDPDYATMTKDTLFEKLSSGKLMSVYDNSTFVARTYNPAIAQIDPNAYFDIIEPLENQDGVTRSYRYNKDWTDNVAVVSSQTKYPERIMEMMNWLYTEEGSLVSNFGIEGVHYDMVDGVPTIKQELIDQCADAADVYTAVSGKLGAGLLGMGYYIDESLQYQTADPILIEQGEKITQWTDQGEITYLPGWPSFTEEEQEQVTEIEQKLTNVFNQEIDGFITGKTAMDKWPELVERLKSQGSKELEDIFNASYGRVK